MRSIIKTGNFLFKWRSYIPLPAFAILFVGLIEQKPHDHNIIFIWEPFCLFVSFLGLGVRVLTIGYIPKGTSGRNTKNQIAETLNTTGMYSIVRHPLYLGNFFISLGLLLFVKTWYIIALCLIAIWLYYRMIILAEEEFLQDKFGNAFSEWSEKTPALIPKFANWQSPSLTFSFKNVLKREYPGFFGIIVSFAFLKIIENRMATGKFWLGHTWILMLAFGFATYIILRTLKRKTNVLDVEGR